MHPLFEKECDELIENPAFNTPPPEPPKPKPPYVRKPRVWVLPPKFPLLPELFYSMWCNHRKQLEMATPIINARPPVMLPNLKPNKMNYYSRILDQNMRINKFLLKKINLIQRLGGDVSCHRVEPCPDLNKRRCKARQNRVNEIRKQNKYFYTRLLVARSEQPLTKEFDELWQDTKEKLILGATLPFILFKTEKIDRGVKDPKFEKPPNIERGRVMMDIRVAQGAKQGKIVIELFTDIVPKTCSLFLSLIKGDSKGNSYTGTKFFRIVPNLYCRGGDVVKNNGFGVYLPPGVEMPLKPENFKLKHSVPGVMSMAVTNGEITGQFNIIFKPLPQLDGKHVVFARVVGGPPQALERISALGLPLGTTHYNTIIYSCGYMSPKAKHFQFGKPNPNYPVVKQQ